MLFVIVVDVRLPNYVINIKYRHLLSCYSLSKIRLNMNPREQTSVEKLNAQLLHDRGFDACEMPVSSLNCF